MRTKLNKEVMDLLNVPEIRAKVYSEYLFSGKPLKQCFCTGACSDGRGCPAYGRDATVKPKNP